MSFDRDALSRHIVAHGPTVRIVIVAHKGSTPRETGTAMLVSTAACVGTIGGGALEYKAIAEARTLLSPEAPNRKHLSFPLGPGLGQCCGGAVELLMERFDTASLPNIDQTYARPLQAGLAEMPRAVRAAVNKPVDVAQRIGGWFVEPAQTRATPVWIWGAGHVGRALAHTVSDLPFAVTWIDDARDRFPETPPAGTDILVANAPVKAVRHAPPDAHHIVLTYSHALDLALCHAILSRQFASLGLIGSATKKARFLRRLAELGHSEAKLSELICPIGHPGLGKEPAAIALGIAFDLLERERAGITPAAVKDDVA